LPKPTMFGAHASSTTPVTVESFAILLRATPPND
jgi:hypothetical protein